MLTDSLSFLHLSHFYFQWNVFAQKGQNTQLGKGKQLEQKDKFY